MIFLNSASSAAALVFYLPGVCTHTDTEGKTEKGQSPEVTPIGALVPQPAKKPLNSKICTYNSFRPF